MRASESYTGQLPEDVRGVGHDQVLRKCNAITT